MTASILDCFRVAWLIFWEVVVMGRADVVVTLPGSPNESLKETGNADRPRR